MEYGPLVIDPTKEPESSTQLHGIFEDLLVALGADMTDANFEFTPQRVARAWRKEFTLQPFNWSVFDEEPYGGTITLVNHQVWTRCPHHLERVRMHVSISYMPDGHRVLGL